MILKEDIDFGEPVYLPGDSKIITLEDAEKAHIIKIYNENNKNITQSASVLNVSINMLRAKLIKYGFLD